MPEENETTAVVEPSKVHAVLPAMAVGQAVQLWETYEELIRELKRDGDFVAFAGKDCPTKQWRTKLERFFALSCEIIKEWHEEERDNTRTYYVTARASHPEGAFHDATGTCNTREKRGNRLFHDTRSHAETRAKNRAVLEMVGYGAVSAEEMETREAPQEQAGETEHEPEPWEQPPPAGLQNGEAPKQSYADWQALVHDEGFAECYYCGGQMTKVGPIKQGKNKGKWFFACNNEQCKQAQGGGFRALCKAPPGRE